MANLLNLLILILISTGALALGVMLAYQMLRLSFALMAPRRRENVRERTVEAAKASI